MNTETRMADSKDPDITDQLSRIRRCRRCECRSCSNGYENHSHRCTEGADCVETQAKLAALQYAWSVIAGQAREEILRLRSENEVLLARIAQLDSIHHG